MISKEKNHILYIEPRKFNEEPIIDSLTKKMTAALRAASRGDCYMGYHVCICGATSCACERMLPNGQMTNTLAVHYLAHHRNEIPRGELKKVEALPYGEEEPTQEELDNFKKDVYRVGDEPTLRRRAKLLGKKVNKREPQRLCIKSVYQEGGVGMIRRN